MPRRRCRTPRWVSGWTVLAALLPAAAFSANPGETGLAFLKIGVGARAAGMGEAYAAVAQDATSIYWNPAGIANSPGYEVHATHDEWISDVRYEYVAGVKGMKGHALGAHVGLLHMGELEQRDETGQLTGHFRTYDLSAGLSYGRRMTRSIELGVTAKYLYEKIQDYGASGFAFDLGGRIRTGISGLTIAATASNLGGEMKFINEPFLLPINARLGAAYRSRALLEGFILAADIKFPNDTDARGHLGAELQVHEMFAVRGGLKLGYDEEAGSLGFGVHYLAYDFDYAYSPFSNSSELGDVHRFSFGWRPPS
jgi:hypothetical protein